MRQTNIGDTQRIKLKRRGQKKGNNAAAAANDHSCQSDFYE